ncbi:MAG: restriction endonuclease subunit S [Gammaproteobacteria bacterium]|nr:restriction endonuclease subunit S [Gammaproteobacteria bacterium]
MRIKPHSAKPSERRDKTAKPGAAKLMELGYGGGEWQMSPLGDLIDVKHGFAFQGKYIHDEPPGDILLTPGNFAIGGGFKGDKFKYYDGPVPNEFVLKEGDLLVTMTDLSKRADTLGFPAFVPTRKDGRRYLHNQRLGKVLIKDKNALDARYLHYVLCGSEYRNEVFAGATGTTVKHTSPDRIKRFRFARPRIEEQRAIAHILGTLDDKIELNRRMNETLEAMARALFKSWFVDFDPVRAKMEGRWRKGESLPGLPAHLYDLFPDSFEESELGEIPKGWELGSFGGVVEHLRGQENPLSSPEALYHHFSLPAFDEGQSPKAEYGESIKSQKSRVPAGVVLLSKLNPEIERVWLVDVRPAERAVCSTEFLVLRAQFPFTRSFVYCLARSPLFRQQIEGLVTGTSKSHQRAQVDSILHLAVVVPPSSIAAAFDRSAEGLLARTLKCRRESCTLAALRDALLPKLISGDLRATDTRRRIGRRVP